MNLQQTIGMYRQKWMHLGQWQDPSINDALDFAAEELGEAFRVFNKMKRGYVRNNPGEAVTANDLVTECFDCIMMLTIAIDLLGFSLDDVATRKLHLMDTKREAKNEVPGL